MALSLTSSSRGQVAAVAPLQDAIRDFRSALTDDQRRDLETVKKVPDADTVLIFTAELDAANSKRRGRSLGTRLYPFLQSVQDFATVVDTWVSSHPEIAALVWGSVKLTILAALNFTSYFEALSGVFLTLGRLCPRLREYQLLYPDSVRVQKALSRFHARIVIFCKHVVEVIQRPWQQQLLKSFQGSLEQEFKPDLDEIGVFSTEVRDELELAKAQADLHHQRLQCKDRREAKESRLDLRRLILGADHKLDTFGTRQLQALAHCVIREMVQWEPIFNVLVLWQKASVIDHVLLQKADANLAVAFFFLTSNSEETLDPGTILRSLLRQVLESISDSQKLDTLLEGVSEASFSDIDEVVKLICKTASQLSVFFIIIDGLDEAEKHQRVKLLSALDSILSRSSNIKIFLAGRDGLTGDIKKQFVSLEHALMSCSTSQDEISAFIQATVTERLESEDLVVGDPSLIGDIISALTEGAEGMYLWVTFQIYELCSQTCDDDIRKAIRNLPRDLAETFGRALRRIRVRGHASIAQKAFLWAAAAKRPLSLDELREALHIELGQSYSMPERLVNGIHRISAWCENLVEIDEMDETVRFAHHSIRDFLVNEASRDQAEEYHIDIVTADNTLGEICVTYLGFSDFTTTVALRPRAPPPMAPVAIAQTALAHRWPLIKSLNISKISRQVSSAEVVRDLQQLKEASAGPGAESMKYRVSHPFLAYASVNWLQHTRRLQEDSAAFLAWRNIVIDGNRVVRMPWEAGPFTEAGVAIADWAYEARHFALLRLLLREEPIMFVRRHQMIKDAARKSDFELFCVFNVREYFGLQLRDIFEAAAEGGHPHIINTTLEGAAHGRLLLASLDRAPLLAACKYGRAQLVEALLVMTPIVGGTPGAHVASPLHVAAWQGHAHIVQQLLSSGAHVDRCTSSGTPLHLAALWGQFETVQVLLDAGAEVNSRDPHGRTPLLNAARGGFVEYFGNLPIGDSRWERENCTGAPASWPSASHKGAVRFPASHAGQVSFREETREEDVLRPRTFVTYPTDTQTRVADALIAAGADVDAEDCWGETPIEVCEYPRVKTRLWYARPLPNP